MNQSPEPPQIPTEPATPAPPQPSLIEYPSQFPIKVMGLKVDGLVAAVTHVATSLIQHLMRPPSSCAKARAANTWALRSP